MGSSRSESTIGPGRPIGDEARPRIDLDELIPGVHDLLPSQLSVEMLTAIKESLQPDRPLGPPDWQAEISKKFPMSYDIFIENSIGDDELAVGIGSALELYTDQVAVTEDIELADENNLVLIVREMLEGEFSTYISVYLKPEIIGLTEEEFARRLSKRFGCHVLLSDESPNPYLWKLMSPNGEVQNVLLQDEPLDERGEVFICPET